MSQYKVLTEFIEKAQKHGAYNLQEADTITKCKEVLCDGVTNPKLDEKVARTVYIQALNKGQKSGAYSLLEAGDIFAILVELTKGETQIQTQLF